MGADPKLSGSSRRAPQGLFVIPAKAGIQRSNGAMDWIPAFAGMTLSGHKPATPKMRHVRRSGFGVGCFHNCAVPSTGDDRSLPALALLWALGMAWLARRWRR